MKETTQKKAGLPLNDDELAQVSGALSEAYADVTLQYANEQKTELVNTQQKGGCGKP